MFSDPDKSIFTTKPIDFNNDGLEDIIIVYTDGSIKLAKNYGYGPNFKNLENLMLIATNIQEVHIGDIDGNGYPDIIIQTTNNQLRAYLNTYGKFDVDGNPFCLNTNVEAGEVSKNPIDTSSVYQIFLEDMDKDNSLDIITNDHKGFVKIFYGGKNGQGTYISKDKATCDT
ncbi:MAG: VCBS repeat-containing protein [Candidatus Peribacteria bacterium]|nr:VCBS repeat-containing protein [Candidatus Peribacteria bacterium]